MSIHKLIDQFDALHGFNITYHKIPAKSWYHKRIRCCDVGNGQTAIIEPHIYIRGILFRWCRKSVMLRSMFVGKALLVASYDQHCHAFAEPRGMQGMWFEHETNQDAWRVAS
jgi:hypothetical protein